MNKTLTKVALCYRAVCLDINREEINNNSEVTVPVMAFVARLKENGFCVSEELLHALNAVSADTLAEITECINDVMGVDLNWAPLVKGWSMPTGESCADHLQTWIANIFGEWRLDSRVRLFNVATLSPMEPSLWSDITDVHSVALLSILPTLYIRVREAS